ncbi:MAG: Mth938-like domain-containing protein [Marinosulfonomonas sp.]
MQLNEIVFQDAAPIDGYGPGFFRVGGQVAHGDVLLQAERCMPWGGYSDSQSPLELKDQIDVLFVGTGKDTAHIPAEFRHALEQAGIGVEAMSTPAACRTYNVLLSEGRRVAAALLAV